MAQAHWMTLLGSALGVSSAGYAALAAWLDRRRAESGPAAAPAASATSPTSAACAPRPVSVLKPLSGGEPRLYENLATLCRQDLGQDRYQLVFGVREEDDPAVAVVRRLQADFPDCDMVLVIDGDTHGRNLKVGNLINMLPHARHDWLVLADSDIAVGPDYLRRVTAPLADAANGIVTCLYRGRALGRFWQKIGVQFIDDWFVPSVRIAHAGGSRRFAFGATIALRREALNRIGGFAALSGRLADDYWLGELTRREGLTTVLSDVTVTTDVGEASLAELWAHEMRWLRTIRSINPAGFRFVFITFTWPMLLLAMVLAPTPAVLTMAIAGLLARCLQAGGLGAALRAPLRDSLLLAEWATAQFGQQVHWRGQRLSVSDAHHLHHPTQETADLAASKMPKGPASTQSPTFSRSQPRA
jgi:ceramide glucosyltransferase